MNMNLVIGENHKHRRIEFSEWHSAIISYCYPLTYLRHMSI